MSFIDAHLLTLLTFVPAAGAVLVLLVGALGQPPAVVKAVAVAAAAAALLLAVRLVSQFDDASGALQLVEKAPWIKAIHVDYFVGVDGFSVLLLVLAALIVPLAMLASWNVTENVKTYFALMLVMETAMFGVFTALNFFHWFIYWELSLVPAYFLIKMWGGPNAHKAALKFFLYTLVGSVTMLLGFQAIYLATGTFDFIEFAQLAKSGGLLFKLGNLAAGAGLSLSMSTVGLLVFAGILLAFLVKAPLWPFHTWLPDAYAEAPAPVTMLLTAVLSKMGIYGLLRIVLPLFPDMMGAASSLLLGLAVVTVVASAFAACAQTDLKRVFAYSSVNHVAFCLLGIFAACVVVDPTGLATSATGSASVLSVVEDRAAALNGVVLQMFNHGIGAAALFFLLGVLEERTNRRGLRDFGGLRKVVPWFSLAFGVALFSSLGLPGLSGFVGELLIFKGALALDTVLTVVATLGLIITAVFLLTIMQKVWWGPVNAKWEAGAAAIADLTFRERVIASVFLAFIVVGGLCPGPFVAMSNATVMHLVALIGGAR